MSRTKLLIEPYTYYSLTEKRLLFYNTFSGDALCTTKKECIMFFKKVKDRSIEFSSLSGDINDFIFALKDKYMISLFNSVSKIPGLDYNTEIVVNDLKKLKKQDSIRLEGYIRTINLFLTTKCAFNCNYCTNANYQFLCCYKNEKNDDMQWDDLELIIQQIPLSTKINILGGDILRYPEILKVLEYINTKDYNDIAIFLNANTFDENNIKTIQAVAERVKTNILISPDNISFIKKYSRQFNYPNVYFSALITEEQEYNAMVQNMPESLLKNCSFHPYYTSENELFFEQNVFLEEEDIFDQKQSTLDIERKKLLNINHFGKLSILPDGNVHTILKRSQIGNILEESLHSIVEKELLNKGSWFETRKEYLPCNLCSYNELCPSPSGLENLIGKYNLCFYNPYQAKWQGEEGYITVEEWREQQIAAENKPD